LLLLKIQCRRKYNIEVELEMSKLNTSSFRVVTFIVLPLIVFASWFGWKSYDQANTQFVEEKVKNALDQSMQSLSMTLPRIQVTDTQSGEVYYEPDLLSKFHAFDLYGQTLILLNEDLSVPTMKLSSVSTSEDYGKSTITLRGQATVDFPLILGINKEIIVQSSIQIPHFETTN
jgi:hypothetical protein